MDEENNLMVGIDFVRIYDGVGVYAIYESGDGGKGWKKKCESTNMGKLLQVARQSYESDTILFMSRVVKENLTTEIAENIKREIEERVIFKSKSRTNRFFIRMKRVSKSVFDFFFNQKP